MFFQTGPGGLSLYHSIQKNLNQAGTKFKVKIFERESSPHDRYQGCIMNIYKFGVSSLFYSLPTEVQARLPDAMPDPIPNIERHGLDVFDHTGKKLLEMPVYKYKNVFEFVQLKQKLPWFFIYRNTLREILLNDVDVQWGKKCIRYEETDEGVCAIFEDGSREFGNLLVGADGINSPIRMQKMPNLQVKDSGVSYVVTDVYPTKKLANQLISICGNCIAQESIGQKGDNHITLMRLIPIKSELENREDQIYYRFTLMYCELTDTLLELWSLVPTDTPESMAKTPFKMSIYPKIRQMIDIDPLSVTSWETSRVILLGNSVTFQDIESLTNELLRYESDGWKVCIQRYEQEMRARSSKISLKSTSMLLLTIKEYGYFGIIVRNLIYKVFNVLISCLPYDLVDRLFCNLYGVE
ncbi:4861_t:CDS:2 [Scutellospora calospora]|uniref:4861_t:CDS:1 n=1 Tax=Scutellospora calospora TaxID=85575 RepID=A0ACA9JY19_9GLOM|nr:4861_t:CDS:2 [Scutellospora calospora]